MFKQTSLALLVSCISISSYAYSVRTTFTIENKTDTDMKISIDQPRGQPSIDQVIPARMTTQIMGNNGADYLENGDHGGSLNTSRRAPFYITDKNGENVYVHGQLVYHVSSLLWQRSSFLDSVYAADGFKTDMNYSCREGGANTIFNSKITIEGKPENILVLKSLNENPGCNGVKSSSVDKDLFYRTICYESSANEVSTFWMDAHSERCSSNGCTAWFTYYDGKEYLPIKIKLKSISVTPAELKDALDKVACGTRL